MPTQPTLQMFDLNDVSRRRFVESVVAMCKQAGTIGRATFVKKDGSIRNLRFIAAQSKGYEAKGSQAAETAKKNNPHHIRLIDLELYTRAKKAGADKQTAMSKAFRIVNAETCLELRAHGVTFKFDMESV